MSEEGESGAVESGAEPGNRQALLRSAVRWFEAAADILAWRIKCRDDGVALSWVDEVAKSRAVLSSLTRLGFLPEGGFPAFAGLVRVSDSLADADAVLRVIAPVLERRYEEFLPSEAAGISNSNSHGIRVAVGRGLLGCVARIVLDDLITREFEYFMISAFHPPRTDAFVKRMAKVSSTDNLLGRALAADAKAHPELALAASLAMLAAARLAVASGRVDVRRNKIRVKRKKALARRKTKQLKNLQFSLIDSGSESKDEE